MKKILASDYDGTFYLNERNIKKNVKEVKDFRKKGNIFILATGNNYEHFLTTVKKYNIEYDYLVLDNGAFIIDNNNSVLATCFIDPDVVKEISKMVKNECDNMVIYNEWKEIKEIGNNHVTKICTKIKNIEEAQSITNEINKKYKDYVRAYLEIFKDYNIIDIISCKTSKMEAIKKVSNIEKVKNSDVYVVGDGCNDITMIKKFNGYCMKNSVKELLNSCKNRVSSVSNLIEDIEEC